MFSLPEQLVGIAALVSASAAQLSINDRLAGDIVPAHDPALIREDGVYYSYSTGQRDRLPLLARSSNDLLHWRALPSPFARIPRWALAEVPNARSIWAPDLAKVGIQYRLYYAVSTFGSQRSVIGLATALTLDPAAANYGWHDQGSVIASHDGDSFNAIDPNFVRDSKGGQWLAFGSFWTGIKIIKLDPVTGKPLIGAVPISIARREVGREDAIEAPFIVDHGGWYWLIVSFDHCCRSIRSDYHLVIGRSRSITGPYVDEAGRPMLQGGGTMLLQADSAGQDRYRGPGHAGFLHDRDGRDYLIYHAYDAASNGAPTLRIAEIQWQRDGWPIVKT